MATEKSKSLRQELSSTLCSPDVNPIERGWKLARRFATHNRYFSGLAEITAAVERTIAQWRHGNEALRRVCAIIQDIMYRSEALRRCFAPLKYVNKLTLCVKSYFRAGLDQVNTLKCLTFVGIGPPLLSLEPTFCRHKTLSKEPHLQKSC